MFWRAGGLYQVVHKLRRQGVLLFLNPVLAFCWVSYGVIPCVCDCRHVVGCQGDEVVRKTFHYEVFFPLPRVRELGSGFQGEVQQRPVLAEGVGVRGPGIPCPASCPLVPWLVGVEQLPPHRHVLALMQGHGLAQCVPCRQVYFFGSRLWGQWLEQSVGAWVPAGGVSSPESWSGAINAAWYWAHDEGSCHPAELLGV